MEVLHDKRYTYSDYASWDTEERYELIDGMPYVMKAPSEAHQRISGNLYLQLGNYLKGKHCRVYHAPFDVRLNVGSGDDTVVQPDIIVVCDRSKLSNNGYEGAPDFVIEIASPSSAGNDRVLKFNQYLKTGVREYWIVDPDTGSVQACILQNGKYVVSIYFETATVPVHVLEGCEISLPDVFAEG